MPSNLECSNSVKYVYFIPLGGFNDILCRLAYVLNYCERTGRILLLPPLNAYRVDLLEYFSIDTGVSIIHDSVTIDRIITTIDSSLCDIPRSHATLYDRSINECTYPEPSKKILRYICCGGGPGIEMFSRLKMSEKITDYIKRTYQQIPKPYISTHVRYTDTRTDYTDILTLIKLYKLPIYLATDNPCVLKKFKSIIGTDNVYNSTTFTSSELIQNHGLHYDPDSHDDQVGITSETRVLDMLRDLAIVCLSTTFITTEVHLANSGYNKLCKSLHEHKEDARRVYNI